jgi:hypothetical protein
MRSLLVVVALIVGGCSTAGLGTAGPAATATVALTATVAVTGTREPLITASPLVTPRSTPATYTAGDTVTLIGEAGPYARITVGLVSVHASYKDSDGYTSVPGTAGYVYVQAFVTYEALADEFRYNLMDWTVKGAGFPVWVDHGGPEPMLTTGNVPEGTTAKGWVVYEVPPTGVVRMLYKMHRHFTLATPAYSEPEFEVVIRAA